MTKEETRSIAELVHDALTKRHPKARCSVEHWHVNIGKVLFWPKGTGPAVEILIIPPEGRGA